MYYLYVLSYLYQIFLSLDYVSWRGRYCPFEYQSFENFMQFILAQAMSRPPPGYDPWDPNVKIDALSK